MRIGTASFSRLILTLSLSLTLTVTLALTAFVTVFLPYPYPLPTPTPTPTPNPDLDVELQQALSLLDGMGQVGLEADLHAYNGVLHALVGAQRVQRED